MPVPAPLKTVVVLGAAYAGARPIGMLAAQLPLNWRIVVIDRSTHFCHIYAFPRVSILPGHEQKVFVPNTTIFTGDTMTGEAGKNPSPERHMWIHGSVNIVGKSSVRYTPFISKQEQSVLPIKEKPKTKDEVLEEGEEQEISFDYLIYALGAKYPSPINIHVPHPLPSLSSLSISGPSQTVLGEKTHELNPTPKGVRTGVGIVETSSSMGTKPEGVKWMRESQDRIKRARKILVVGGGALGVQMATDIQATHGSSKKITLLHSRAHLLNRFDPWMHEESLCKMREMGIEVILGERVDMGYVNHQEEGKVRCVSGRELEADLILWCTGQSPNSHPLTQYYPGSILPRTGLISINRSLQLSQPLVPPPSSEGTPDERKDSDFRILNPRVFVAGDCADAFGALNAGHTAWAQGGLAAENILTLIRKEEGIVVEDRDKEREDPKGEGELGEYTAPSFGIKVSLGREYAIFQRNGKHGSVGKEDCHDDLNSGIMWTSRGLTTEDWTV